MIDNKCTGGCLIVGCITHAILVCVLCCTVISTILVYQSSSHVRLVYDTGENPINNMMISDALTGHVACFIYYSSGGD